jgi:Holliday junction resolvase RusA-like endonuclease
VIEFHVDGPVVGKARPRVTRNGTYTPAETVAYEYQIQRAAKRAMWGNQILLGPVRLHLEAGYQIPASFSQKKAQACMFGHVCPIVKPDLDNVLKALGDACNKVVWKDDSQIVEVSMRKKYTIGDGYLLVAVEEIR